MLKQGVTPKKVALSMACGVVLGIFPVVGTTTLLCIMAAILLKLNPITIQIFNWLVYPLQILLLIPFFKLGDYLFQVKLLPLNTSELTAMFRADIFETMYIFWRLILHGIVVWLLIAPALVLGMYVV
ncbi:DUF2062 domain-containing protein, partial [Planctomycetota bacterium]